MKCSCEKGGLMGHRVQGTPKDSLAGRPRAISASVRERIDVQVPLVEALIARIVEYAEAYFLMMSSLTSDQ